MMSKVKKQSREKGAGEAKKGNFIKACLSIIGLVGLAGLINFGGLRSADAALLNYNFSDPPRYDVNYVPPGFVFSRESFSFTQNDFDALAPGSYSQLQYGATTLTGEGWTFDYGSTSLVVFADGAKTLEMDYWTIQHGSDGPVLGGGPMTFDLSDSMQAYNNSPTDVYGNRPEVQVLILGANGSHLSGMDGAAFSARLFYVGGVTPRWVFNWEASAAHFEVPELPAAATVPLVLVVGLGLFMLRRSRRFTPAN